MTKKFLKVIIFYIKIFFKLTDNSYRSSNAGDATISQTNIDSPSRLSNAIVTVALYTSIAFLHIRCLNTNHGSSIPINNTARCHSISWYMQLIKLI